LTDAADGEITTKPGRPEFADVHEVTVEKVGQQTFRITASGFVQGYDWTVNLHASIYLHAPETWIIDAVVIAPTTPSAEVNVPWRASTELFLTLHTHRISVRGQGDTITKSVPW